MNKDYMRMRTIENTKRLVQFLEQDAPDSLIVGQMVILEDRFAVLFDEEYRNRKHERRMEDDPYNPKCKDLGAGESEE